MKVIWQWSLWGTLRVSAVAGENVLFSPIVPTPFLPKIGLVSLCGQAVVSANLVIFPSEIIIICHGSFLRRRLPLTMCFSSHRWKGHGWHLPAKIWVTLFQRQETPQLYLNSHVDQSGYPKGPNKASGTDGRCAFELETYKESTKFPFLLERVFSQPSH